MKTLFIVDDNVNHWQMLSAALELHYRVFVVENSEALFRKFEEVRPDLIILEIEMSKMSGLDIIRYLKSEPMYKYIPVILVTGISRDYYEREGLRLGAVDFITIPVESDVLLKRVQLQLEASELSLQHRLDLLRWQKNVILVVASLVEGRDATTGSHVERTASYVAELIKALIERDIYADELRKWDIPVAITSSLLHDVGKISISDLILNKPGLLTSEEYQRMKIHTSEGERIISEMITVCGRDEFLENARLFAGYHHEYWNGQGYPYGLSGDKIPLHGRILAVADVYDALVSERPYKKAMPHKRAYDIITVEAGKQFDPILVKVFCEIEHKFEEIQKRFHKSSPHFPLTGEGHFLGLAQYTLGVN